MDRSREGETTGSLSDHFRSLLLQRPELEIFRFLEHGEGEAVSLTNQELDLRARAIGARLRERAGARERALIMCPPGLDYVVAFFAALYAGVVAVPVEAPSLAHPRRTLPRLVGIVADAEPAVVLAPSSVCAEAEQLAEHAPCLAGLAWQSVDGAEVSDGGRWEPVGARGEDIALLQYTSGSTSLPKGVMVTQGNLLHNLGASDRMMERREGPERHMVTWLPPHHNMGLIGSLLHPAYAGFPVTIMSPLAFLERPARWLRTISRVGATVSGAPNFAFDLCVSRVTDEEREGLDLSTWELAFNGAEQVRVETVEKFSRAFEPYGFRRNAFYPCYGLAEATLAISGGDRGAGPVVRELGASALASGRAIAPEAGEGTRTRVGCGRAAPGHEVCIVAPEERTRLGEREVGEVWVSGPSVASGYWRRPAEAADVFGAHLAVTGEGPFLRTGDLGFVDGGELFITGRLKDVIIVAGKNYYAEDIERAAERSHPSLRPGCTVACSLEGEGTDRLLVVHEVNGNPGQAGSKEIMAAVRRAVAEEIGLAVQEIVLVPGDAVPKTPSGKVRRAPCREAFLEGSLGCLASWSAWSEGSMVAEEALAADREDREGFVLAAAPVTGAAERSGGVREELLACEPGRMRREALVERCKAEVARVTRLDEKRVDVLAPLASMGLDSLRSLELRERLEKSLRIDLPAAVALRYPTIELLVPFLAARMGIALEGSSVPKAERPAVEEQADNDHDRLDLRAVSVGVPCSEGAPVVLGERPPVEPAGSRTGSELRPSTAVRLLCLPYGGGQAAVYRRWQDMVPSHVEVCPVELPGRGERMSEVPFTRMEPLVSELKRSLDLDDRPFAIFGHSLGGLIAFELARALRATGKPQPDHLFISAIGAPGTLSVRPAHRYASDEQLKQELRTLGGTPEEFLEDEVVMKMTLSLLRADLSVLKTYEYHQEPPLAVPITVFGGTSDQACPPSALDGWRDESAKARFQFFPGGHFFVHSAAAQVVAAVVSALGTLSPRLLPANAAHLQEKARESRTPKLGEEPLQVTGWGAAVLE
jgi:acyl-CoA synthetase (AMP-forming)/AMP-acid ligase II/surfactin synthase thioesterase subunit/acyl carrier protein